MAQFEHSPMNKLKAHYSNTYRESLLSKIESFQGQVFTRKDLESDYSNQAQLRLNRALKAFLKEGLILKISHGLYAKAEPMSFTNGKIKPVLQESFETVAMEALNKLNVKWELGSAIQEYNRGETTQVPAVFSVQLKSRFRGKISVEGRSLVFERKVNAR